jgi:hypothetical protein
MWKSARVLVYTEVLTLDTVIERLEVVRGSGNTVFRDSKSLCCLAMSSSLVEMNEKPNRRLAAES